MSSHGIFNFHVGSCRKRSSSLANGDRFLGKLSLVRIVRHPRREIHAYSQEPSKRWIVDRTTLHHARLDDLKYVDDPEHLDFLGIYFANGASSCLLFGCLRTDVSLVITKLGRKLQFRQRVIATATVFFRRFYLKNSYCETDPFTVIAACCYLAAKAEESPIHIKSVVQESRTIFNRRSSLSGIIK